MNWEFFCPNWVRGLFNRKAAEKHARRSAGAKRGWETRRQREQGLPLPMDHNPLLKNDDRPGSDASGT